MDGTMKDNTSAGSDMPSSPAMSPFEMSVRYSFVYGDICRFCQDMWANIATTRSRASQHIVASVSLLGLYLALDAAIDAYEIGWLGLVGIITEIAIILPHFRIVVGFVEVDERHLDIDCLDSPRGTPELAIIIVQGQKAEELNQKSKDLGNRYLLARNLWFAGTALSIALGVLEWPL